MIRRARLLAVVAILAAGGAGILSSTQTWLEVSLQAGGDVLLVPGASAAPVLAPLSLAVLALGGALSIVGTVLRYVFGALSVAAAAALLTITVPIVVAPPVTAVASVVTEHTGITGNDAVAGLVGGIQATAWPAVTFAAGVLLALAGLFSLATAHTWRRTGRRYEAAAPTHAGTDTALDAVDSWDELSRGEDPTRGPR